MARALLVVALALAAGCAGSPAPDDDRLLLADGAPDPAHAAAVADLASRLGDLVDGPTDRADERAILALLEEAAPAVLDAALREVDLDELLDDVDDRVFGPEYHSELLDLLARRRVADLSVTTRAALLDALQRGDTDEASERAVRDLLLATRGRALTRLKAAVDAGADHRDLAQLVFHDLDDADLRAEVLEHFEREAAPSGRLKVLSDIDDTLYANWTDERYPSKTVYPGVLALYAALDRGPLGDDPEGDLVFVTARPGDPAGVVEGVTHDTLRELGVPAAVVLTGDLTSVLGDEAIAREKLANFQRYRSLFPEFAFVFVGDSGQGDADFGRRMLEAHPDAVRGVLIHDVVGTPAEERAEWRARGVRFFDTYVGAAAEAHALGLIGDLALSRVAGAAVEELEGVGFPTPGLREARFEELVDDLYRANARLPEALRVTVPD